MPWHDGRINAWSGCSVFAYAISFSCAVPCLQYKKAIASITVLDYEITEENAKGLGKGKTKVAGIGKGTADKIHEYYSTGTIQKLEEKRLIHS